MYKSNLEIKNLKKNLEEKKLPEHLISPFAQHMKEMVDGGLKSIAKDIVVEFYKVPDKERRNELLNHLSKALKILADHIDKGATFEVQAKEPVQPENPENSENNPAKNAENEKKLKEYNELKELASIVNKRSEAITRFEQSDGPLLMIEEVDPDKPDK